MSLECWTPPGPGGVAVLVLQGEQRHQEARRMFGLEPAVGGGPRLVTLRLGREELDEALWVDRPAQARLELHLHGSPALLARIEAAHGPLRVPIPGRAEALLQGARSRAQLALALEQRSMDLVGLCANRDGLAGSAWVAELQAAERRSVAALALANPQRLLLCGLQNAGKSTLMNRLLFQERALTGSQPGLTRDPLREHGLLGGYRYELIDTAGEGAAVDALDVLAQERGRQLREGAILLLVADGSQPAPTELASLREAGALLLRTKTDLPVMPWPSGWTADLALSCLDPTQAGAARQVVGELLRRHRLLPAPGPAGGVAALDGREMEMLAAACSQATGG